MGAVESVPSPMMRSDGTQEVEESVCRSLQNSRTEEEVMASIAPGWQAASAIIALLEVDDPGDDKELEIWLQAWARKNELELLPHSWQEPMTLPMAWQGDERCGGPAPKRGGKELVVPRLGSGRFLLIEGASILLGEKPPKKRAGEKPAQPPPSKIVAGSRECSRHCGPPRANLSPSAPLHHDCLPWRQR